MSSPFEHLRRIRIGERRAEPGKFRIVFFMGDVMYAVGEDVVSLAEVPGIIETDLGIQVYDDRGESRLAERKES